MSPYDPRWELDDLEEMEREEAFDRVIAQNPGISPDWVVFSDLLSEEVERIRSSRYSPR